MKSTLAENKQLFNVKAVAAAGLTPAAIPEGSVGFVDPSTNLTVVPANFAAMPARIFIISKLNGKVIYSFDAIEKEKIKNLIATDYKAPVVNIWKGMINSCNCIDNVQLIVNLDDSSLRQRDGLTWTHRDMVHVVSTQEMKCYCDCSGKNPVYENNVFTMLMVKKVQEMNSEFYTASAMADITGIASSATLPLSPAAGNLYIKTGVTTPGLSLYNGAAWVVVGDILGNLTNIEAFVEGMKAINTDDNAEVSGPKLSIILTGKPITNAVYNDLEINYTEVRGVKLTPAVSVDGQNTGVWTEIQKVGYEIGAGYDLRAEEWENMNYYTNMNHRATLSDGMQSKHLSYQFENSTNYNTVTMEFYTDKVERNNGDKRLFGVLFGTSVTSEYNKLKAMFSL